MKIKESLNLIESILGINLEIFTYEFAAKEALSLHVPVAAYYPSVIKRQSQNWLLRYLSSFNSNLLLFFEYLVVA